MQLSNDQTERLKDFIISLNEKLEETGTSSANQAFNLGCWVGFVPVALIVVVILIATRGEWILALLTALMLTFALAGFANFAAYRARIHSVDRVYQNEVLPQINQILKDFEISRMEFDLFAAKILPPEASFQKYISEYKTTGENF